MNSRLRQSLLNVGIEVERYYVGDDPYCYPPVWGIALVRDGEEIACIESHGAHTDNDSVRNKYVTRTMRAQAGKVKKEGRVRETKLYPVVAVHRTQREAIAAAVKRDQR